jgi:hypothetical protein
MTPQPTRIRLLRVAIDTPIGFTLFMFLGQPLFLIALVLLVGAILADLKIRQLL